MDEKNNVGSKIRQLRELQGLSVAELAERSQSSADLIEHIEAGALVPSLTPLLRLARALGVRLGTFVDDELQPGPVVVRAGHSEKVVRFSGKSPSTQASALDFHALASNKRDRHMEPYLIDVHPAAPDACALSSHEGEEFLYVLEGQIEVAYGATRYQLEAGDSIYYDSVVPHDVHAAGGADARILAMVYAPF